MKKETIILLLRVFFSIAALFCVFILAMLTDNGFMLPKWTAIPSAVLAVICLVIAILLTPNGTKKYYDDDLLDQ